MNMDKTVCYCMHITNGMIKDAVMAGDKNLEEVMKRTKAGTVCGACRMNICHLIDQFVDEKNNPAT